MIAVHVNAGVMLAAIVVLSSCSQPDSVVPPLTQEQKSRAITITQKYASQIYNLPHCDGTDHNWHAIIKEDQDIFRVEIGPGKGWGKGVRVTFTKSNMKVKAVQRFT